MVEQELKATLGKNIKFFRFRQRLSQFDLAEEAGISVTFLSNIERGNNFPHVGTLCNLARALNVEVWELFKGERASDGEKPLVDRISDDFIKYMKEVVETVRQQYKN
jgi:transcriptional regulator with XRE-family HTH domain